MKMKHKNPQRSGQKLATICGDNFRIRFNSELYDILNDIDVVQRLIISGCTGSAMSFVWRRMLRRDGYLMPRSVEDGEEDDLVYVGMTKSRKTCNRLV